MPNVRHIPKPDASIPHSDWNMTPHLIKEFIEHLQVILQQKQNEINNLQEENQWLREKLDLQIEKASGVAPPLVPEIILWAMVGLILTIGGTFVRASIIAVPWLWKADGITIQSLGVSWQIGAVLLTGSLGGRNAAFLSQVAYLILGLLGLPLFDRGGGWQYIFEPHFGYLLGFLVGAWICGDWAFKKLASVNNLMLSCCAGLASIHLLGIVYLTAFCYLSGFTESINSVGQGIYTYSIAPLPGHLAIICGVVAIAYWLRKLVFS
jgi:biotin transport system substrate-specific component